MRKLLLLIPIILFFSTTASATIFNPNIPIWEYWTEPPLPELGCNTSSFTNITPANSEYDVVITGKGVQFCVNITPPQGCNITIQYQWFNYTQFYSDWLEWVNVQPWGWWWDSEDWFDDIDWDNETNPENSTYWHNFTPLYENINQTTQICAYNTNVSCFIENDYTREYFDWRINYSINCSGIFYNDSCNYFFVPEYCPSITYISPPSPNGTICPCCASICLGVNNKDGHNMNLTFFIREDDGFGPFFYGQTQFLNVSNGTYCFCPESMIADIFAAGRTNATITPLAIDTWYNITFENFTSFGITGTPSEVTVPLSGYYTLNYWAACYDNNVAPAGDIIAFRMCCDNTEIPGTYREIQFQKQDNIRSEISLAHVYLEAGCKINFKYLVNDVNIEISEDGTYADYATSSFASITLEQPLQFALKYNTTYEWYATITDATTGDTVTTDIFSFNTYPNPSYCPCGPQDLVDVIETYDTDTIKDDSWLAGLIILFSAFGVLAFVRKRRMV